MGAFFNIDKVIKSVNSTMCRNDNNIKNELDDIAMRMVGKRYYFHKIRTIEEAHAILSNFEGPLDKRGAYDYKIHHHKVNQEYLNQILNECNLLKSHKEEKIYLDSKQIEKIRDWLYAYA